MSGGICSWGKEKAPSERWEGTQGRVGMERVLVYDLWFFLFPTQPRPWCVAGAQEGGLGGWGALGRVMSAAG